MFAQSSLTISQQFSSKQNVPGAINHDSLALSAQEKRIITYVRDMTLVFNIKWPQLDCESLEILTYGKVDREMTCIVMKDPPA